MKTSPLNITTQLKSPQTKETNGHHAISLICHIDVSLKNKYKNKKINGEKNKKMQTKVCQINV